MVSGVGVLGCWGGGGFWVHLYYSGVDIGGGLELGRDLCYRVWSSKCL